MWAISHSAVSAEFTGTSATTGGRWQTRSSPCCQQLWAQQRNSVAGVRAIVTSAAARSWFSNWADVSNDVAVDDSSLVRDFPCRAAGCSPRRRDCVPRRSRIHIKIAPTMAVWISRSCPALSRQATATASVRRMLPYRQALHHRGLRPADPSAAGRRARHVLVAVLAQLTGDAGGGGPVRQPHLICT